MGFCLYTYTIDVIVPVLFRFDHGLDSDIGAVFGEKFAKKFTL